MKVEVEVVVVVDHGAVMDTVDLIVVLVMQRPLMLANHPLLLSVLTSFN